MTRRAFLAEGAALGAAVAVSRLDRAWPASAAEPKPLRTPGSLPHPRLPPGTDTLPEIDHIVVVMMENHSYDNYLGMLRRGDGFTLDHRRQPTAANPDGAGNVVRAFRMPSTCQLERAPGQNWNASHVQYDDGRNDGFVRASGPVAMGYWAKDDLPFYYALASTFPVCDRWFGSCLGQTYPNRRFLLAGTAHGLVSTDVSKILAPSPSPSSWRSRLPTASSSTSGTRTASAAATTTPTSLRPACTDHPSTTTAATSSASTSSTPTLPPAVFLASRSWIRVSTTTSPRRTTPTSSWANRSHRASSTPSCTGRHGRSRY